MELPNLYVARPLSLSTLQFVLHQNFINATNFTMRKRRKTPNLQWSVRVDFTLRASSSMLLPNSMDVGADPLLLIFYSLLFGKSTTPTFMFFSNNMLKGPNILLFNLNKKKFHKCHKTAACSDTNPIWNFGGCLESIYLLCHCKRACNVCNL